ncbi:MAG: DUF3501 family protein [Acidimicrobiales bacterium]|nr:DUF3501 family protein [Acidimicrobiales bacterium]
MTTGQLTLADIADTRAYERERHELRARIVALKKIRRVAVGPIVSLVFENRDTIRFQVQEMVRAERLMTDAAVQTELDVYNPLIPGRGELSASLYIELTSKQEMEHWLPRLVGIEQSVVLQIGGSVPDAFGSVPSPDGATPAAAVVRSDVDPAHADALTRDEVTAAVHFVHFSLTPPLIERFRSGTVALSVEHPEYRERTVLSAETKSSLIDDLLG